MTKWSGSFSKFGQNKVGIFQPFHACSHSTPSNRCSKGNLALKVSKFKIKVLWNKNYIWF